MRDDFYRKNDLRQMEEMAFTYIRVMLEPFFRQRWGGADYQSFIRWLRPQMNRVLRNSKHYLGNRPGETDFGAGLLTLARAYARKYRSIQRRRYADEYNECLGLELRLSAELPGTTRFYAAEERLARARYRLKRQRFRDK
jgi:hypothetical protein